MTHGHKSHPNKRRKDRLTQKLVDIVARIADRGDTEAASAVCAGEGVPFEVALRVISRPKQRRVYKKHTAPIVTGDKLENHP